MCSIAALLSTDDASSVAVVVMTTLLILTAMTMIMMMLLQIFSVSADVDDITEDDDLGDGGKEEAGLGRDSPGTGSGTQESGYGSTCTDSLGYRDLGDSADTEGGSCITFLFDILVITIVSICFIESCLTHIALADLETCGDSVDDAADTQLQTQRHSHKMMVSNKSYSDCLLYRLK